MEYLSPEPNIAETDTGPEALGVNFESLGPDR